MKSYFKQTDSASVNNLMAPLNLIITHKKLDRKVREVELKEERLLRNLVSYPIIVPVDWSVNALTNEIIF